MDHLTRPLAPITELGWEQISDEATRVLTQRLAARRLVSYGASGSWSDSAVGLGRVQPVAAAVESVALAQRQVRPMVEIRVDFAVSRAELDAADRGAGDMDTGPIIEAAKSAALAEDQLIFDGSPGAGIPGIAAASVQPPVSAKGGLLAAVAAGVELLRDSSIAGPNALAVGPAMWVELMAGSDSGYPLLSHLQLMLEGPIVWAPSLSGALLLSQRGGDFEIFGGQDWSIGYDRHDDEYVHLYLQESITSVVNTPDAAVVIGGAGTK